MFEEIQKPIEDDCELNPVDGVEQDENCDNDIDDVDDEHQQQSSNDHDDDDNDDETKEINNPMAETIESKSISAESLPMVISISNFPNTLNQIFVR